MAIEVLHSKDFRIIKGGMIAHGSPGEILPDVNAWIASNAVHVLNVESIFQNGCSGDGIVNEFSGVRIWYITTSNP